MGFKPRYFCLIPPTLLLSKIHDMDINLLTLVAGVSVVAGGLFVVLGVAGAALSLVGAATKHVTGRKTDVSNQLSASMLMLIFAPIGLVAQKVTGMESAGFFFSLSITMMWLLIFIGWVLIGSTIYLMRKPSKKR